MKKKMIFVLSVILFYNCDPKIDIKNIIGKWKVIEFNSEALKLSPIIIMEAKNDALSSFYSFQNDSIFDLRSDNTEKGKYIFENGEIKLIYNNKNKDVEKYVIKSLNSEYMEWIQDFGDIGNLSIILKKE